MRAAIYCRLSEEDKGKADGADSGSIQNQKMLLTQYADAQGWEIYDIYSDDDYAGADRNRPEFNRLLKDAEAKNFDVVLCKTQSRFTRELELVEKYIHGLFPVWGIRFVSVADNCDTDDPGNKKTRQINGLVNEWYLEDMSESIKSVLNSRRSLGLHIGSSAPYGYAKDPAQKGHLIIDEEKAFTVREVFSLFANGQGKTSIARELNARGIPSPGGGLWQYATISRMLQNEVYIGHMVQGRYGSVSYKTKRNMPKPPELWFRVENTHEAIIDEKQWQTVQRLISEKSRPFAGNKAGAFASRVYCACCGSPMRSARSHGESYLRCSRRYISKAACPGGFISVKRLEHTVLCELNRLASEHLDADMLKERCIQCSSSRQMQLSKRISKLQGRIDMYSEAMAKLYLHRAEGSISEADFSDTLKRISSEKQRLMQAAASGAAELKQISPSSTREDIPVLLNALDNAAAETLIERIYIGRRSTGSWEVPVEIHWSF